MYVDKFVILGHPNNNFHWSYVTSVFSCGCTSNWRCRCQLPDSPFPFSPHSLTLSVSLVPCQSPSSPISLPFPLSVNLFPCQFSSSPVSLTCPLSLSLFPVTLSLPLSVFLIPCQSPLYPVTLPLPLQVSLVPSFKVDNNNSPLQEGIYKGTILLRGKN